MVFGEKMSDYAVAVILLINVFRLMAALILASGSDDECYKFLETYVFFA